MESNNITSKMQQNAENACVNGMWQLGFNRICKHALTLCHGVGSGG